MKNTIYAGLDFSLSCPAITIHEGSSWSVENCTFHYLTKIKKYQGAFPPLFGHIYDEYLFEMDRYSMLFGFVLNVLSEYKNVELSLEGYSYRSVGKVFEIGEATGILKWNLHERKIKPNVIAPTSIKKFATGKGNAQKDLMYKYFLKDTQFDLCKHLGSTDHTKSPISDIVDSYFICKYGFNQ